MSFFLDILPLAAFAIAYFTKGIYVATAVLMASCVVQVAVHWLRTRRFEKLHLFSLALAVVLGGFTLWFHNEDFIKWKTSVFLWLVSGVILGRQWFFNTLTIRALGEKLLEAPEDVPEAVWSRVNLVWGWSMGIAGCLNLAVAYTFPLGTWVIYKLVSLIVLNLSLSIYTVLAVRPRSLA